MNHLKFLISWPVAMILCLSFSFKGHCAEWAVVRSEKAVVYADAQMSASIGFLSKGRKIRVGEKPKNKGRVVPIIIQKKIAYIKLVDIERSPKESAVADVASRFNESSAKKLASNKFAVILGSSLASVYFPESATADDQYNIMFFGGGVRMYREEENSTSGVKGTLEYMTGTRDKEKISFLAIPFDYYYKILRRDFLELHLFGGLNLMPFAEYKLSDDFTLNGYGYGVQAGSEFLFKFSSFTIHVEAAYHYNKLMGFKLPDNELYPAKLEPTINSFSLKGLVSFNY